HVVVLDLHPFPTRRSSDLGVFTPKKELSTVLCETMLRYTNQYYAIGNTQKATESFQKLTRRVDSLDAALKYYNTILAQTKDQNRSEEHTSELQSRENLVCR